MKFRTVVEREGELLGPIDWSYDFRYHFFGPHRSCNSAETNQRCMDRAMSVLRTIAPDGATQPEARWRITLDHQFSYELIAVGMYDGWPFWKPTPAVLVKGPLGPEWKFFMDLTDAVRIHSPELRS